MNIDTKLASLFDSSPYPIAQLGPRIYGQSAPPRPQIALPYAVYQRGGRIPLDSHDEQDEPTPTREWRIQITVYDEDRDRALAVADALAAYLKAYRDNGAGIQRFILVNQLELPPTEKTRYTRQVLDFDVMEDLPE